jgi:hypothetical protein
MEEVYGIKGAKLHNAAHNAQLKMLVRVPFARSRALNRNGRVPERSTSPLQGRSFWESSPPMGPTKNPTNQPATQAGQRRPLARRSRARRCLLKGASSNFIRAAIRLISKPGTVNGGVKIDFPVTVQGRDQPPDRSGSRRGRPAGTGHQHQRRRTGRAHVAEGSTHLAHVPPSRVVPSRPTKPALRRKGRAPGRAPLSAWAAALPAAPPATAFPICTACPTLLALSPPPEQ